MTIMYVLFQPKYTKYMYTCIYGTYNDYLISQRTYLNETEIPISVPFVMQNWPFSGILNIV